MSVRVIESTNREWFRFRVSNHKKDVVKISCENIRQGGREYMFVNSADGEIYSHSDAALHTCMQWVNKCGINVYELKAGHSYVAIFQEPEGTLVDIKDCFGGHGQADLVKKEAHGPKSQPENVVAYTSSAHSLKRKASKLNDLTDQVKDGLFTDLAEDCQKASDYLKEGKVEEAKKLLDDIKADAKTMLYTAAQLETVGEGLIAIIEKINRFPSVSF